MNIIVSPAALQDLKEIRKYISVKLCSPEAAERIVKKIISAYLNLSEQPYIGAKLNAKVKIDTPFRYLVNGNYLIFYQVGDNIEIHRIVYGRRDYAKTIFGCDESETDFQEDTED